MNRLFTWACAVILFVCFAASTFAASVDDYQRRIRLADEKAEELIQSAAAPAWKRERAAELLTLLPETETIDWPGGALETENGWLMDVVGDYYKEITTPRGKVVLIGISERLKAIDKSINEINSVAAAARSKDEDKQKLAEILRREEYQKPVQKDESLIQKWINKLLEWLASVWPSPSLPAEASNAAAPLKSVLQVLIYAAVIALLGFLIYKFAPYIARRFGSETKESRGDRVILGERISAEESAHDLFSEAEQLALRGDLRGAIRKGYLAALCELSDRKLIQLARHKTNRDYLRDVRGRSELHQNMSGLTGAFESNWYGLRDSEQQDWEDFRNGYRRTIASV